MLTLTSGNPGRPMCDGISRRGFLKLGALTVGGLTLADLLRLEARGAARRSSKAVIMVWLEGGPSHIDIYDMKPKAPAEIRGEWKPIATKVAGMEICEQLPEQAKITDQLAIIRSMTFVTPDHRPPEELLTGFPNGSNRPALGSVVSRLESDAGRHGAMPPYVQLDALRTPPEGLAFTGFLGVAHKPFIPGKDLGTLTLARDMTLERLNQRKDLLRTFDRLNRELDARHQGMDAFTQRALEMISSPKAATPSTSARSRRPSRPSTARRRRCCRPAGWSRPASRWCRSASWASRRAVARPAALAAAPGTRTATPTSAWAICCRSSTGP